MFFVRFLSLEPQLFSSFAPEPAERVKLKAIRKLPHKLAKVDDGFFGARASPPSVTHFLIRAEFAA